MYSLYLMHTLNIQTRWSFVTVTVLYSNLHPQKWVTPRGSILPPSLPDCPLQREEQQCPPVLGFTCPCEGASTLPAGTAEGSRESRGQDQPGEELLLISSSGITAAGSWWWS